MAVDDGRTVQTPSGTMVPYIYLAKAPSPEVELPSWPSNPWKSIGQWYLYLTCWGLTNRAYSGADIFLFAISMFVEPKVLPGSVIRQKGAKINQSLEVYNWPRVRARQKQVGGFGLLNMQNQPLVNPLVPGPGLFKTKNNKYALKVRLIISWGLDESVCQVSHTTVLQSSPCPFG